MPSHHFISASCNSEDYSVLWENLKYAAQAAYLVPTALLYIRILYVILGKYKKFYGRHQFFLIYSMDAVVGFVFLLQDVFTTRLFIYFPQLCLPVSQFLLSHLFLMRIYYPLLGYLHCCRPFIQIFLTTNRMSSVMFPVDHNLSWQRKLPFIAAFVFLAPFLFLWNALISPNYLIYYFGGFMISYSKVVSWAGMSLFLMIIRSVVVLITVVTTSITFWKMSRMKKRLKRSERMMCVASAAISICFLFPAAFEALSVFSETWNESKLSLLLQPFAWDVLNVGSPLVMISVSGQLRHHVLSFASKEAKSRSNSVFVSLSATHLN